MGGAGRARADPRILVPGWAALLAGRVFGRNPAPDWAWLAIAVGAVLAGLAKFASPRKRAGLDGRHLGRRRGDLCRGAVARSGAVAGRSGMGSHGTFIPVRSRLDHRHFCLFLRARSGRPFVVAERQSRRRHGPAPSAASVGGVAAGVAVAYASGLGKLGIVAVMALLLSVLAQAGDLFESAVKRRFGAKDASHLIPGHGGLMDRIDGFLVAAFAALLIGMLRRDGCAGAAACWYGGA